jgi:hypothetical protein
MEREMELPELPDLPVSHPEYKRVQHERNKFFRDLLDRYPIAPRDPGVAKSLDEWQWDAEAGKG